MSRLRLLIVIAVPYLLPSRAAALFDPKPASILQSSCEGGASSIFTNPAGTRYLKVSELHTYYSHLYSVKDLAHYGTAVAVQTRLGALSAGISQFGPPSYREEEAAVGAAAGLSSKIYAGVSARGYSLKIDRFGEAKAYGIDAGVIARVHPALTMGFSGKNVNRPKLGASQIALPTGLNLGAAVSPFESLKLYMDVSAIEPDPISFRSSMEVGFAGRLFLRGGVQSQSMRFHGGVGLKIRRLRFDYHYLHHGILGGSHQAALSLYWGS